MREWSFLGSLILLIISLITGHYSWVSDVSPLHRTLDMMHSDTLSPTNKQLPCGGTSEALTSVWGLFLDKWISACIHIEHVWSGLWVFFVLQNGSLTWPKAFSSNLARNHSLTSESLGLTLVSRSPTKVLHSKSNKKEQLINEHLLISSTQ